MVHGNEATQRTRGHAASKGPSVLVLFRTQVQTHASAKRIGENDVSMRFNLYCGAGKCVSGPCQKKNKKVAVKTCLDWRSHALSCCDFQNPFVCAIMSLTNECAEAHNPFCKRCNFYRPKIEKKHNFVEAIKAIHDKWFSLNFRREATLP